MPGYFNEEIKVVENEAQYIQLEDDVPPPYHAPREPYDFDDWVSLYFDDLHNMWSILTQYRETSNIERHVLEYATFTDFCKFSYQNSCGLSNNIFRKKYR